MIVFAKICDVEYWHRKWVVRLNLRRLIHGRMESDLVLVLVLILLLLDHVMSSKVRLSFLIFQIEGCD